MSDFIPTELNETFTSLRDRRIKEAIISKGFDPEDLDFMSKNGRIGIFKNTSTLVIQNTPICCWTSPEFKIDINGDTVRVECTFNFKEL